MKYFYCLLLVSILGLSSNAQCDFTISAQNTQLGCLQSEEEAVMTNLAPVINATGNSLTKSGSNTWDGGAASTATVRDFGHASTVINETNTYRMFGLSNSDASTSFNTIEYAIYLVNNGTVRIYESGVNRGTVGTYSTADTATVAVEDGVVKYYINDNLLYTSAVAPTLPMLVDVSIYSDGGTLEQISISNGSDGTFVANATNPGASPTYQWQLNGANVGTNSPTYSNAGLADGDQLTCNLTIGTGGCSTGTISSNQIEMNVASIADLSSVYISSTATNSKCNKAQTQVVWTDLATNMNASGNDLSKSGPNGWDGGAASYQTVADNGQAFTVINETNTYRMFGLSNSNNGTSFNTIDYAIYLVNNGTLRIYESGVNLGNYGSYSTGDTAKVVVEDGTVLYYLNSTLLYTSAASPSLPMVVDLSIFSDGGTLNDVHIVNGTAGDFNATVLNGGSSPSYQWQLNGSNVGSNSSSYSNGSLSVNDVVTCIVTPDASSCTPSTITSNPISYREDNPAQNVEVFIQNIAINSKCNKARTEVVWTDVSGVVNVTANDLSKSGANSWNGGAASYQTVSDNGYAFTVVNETNTNRMFGLSNSNTSSSFNTIDYAIYLVNNGTLRIYESGINRGNVGSYSTGDTAKVVIEDGVVQYYLNSTLIYTSAVSPTLPMVVDISLNSDGSTLEDVFVVNGTAGDFSANVFNAGANPTYQWRLNGANVGTNSSTYSNPSLSVNDVVTCDITPDAPGCTPNSVSSNTITYTEENPSQNAEVYIQNTAINSKCNKARTEVVWTDVASGVNTNGNNLSKTGGNGWDGGAASYQTVSDNGYAFTVVNETNTYRMFGLSTSNTNTSFNAIDYAIFLVNNGTIRIYESGVNLGDYGAYSSGDTAKVVVEDGTVHYYLNSTLLYSSGTTPTLPLLVDVSLYSTGSTLEDVFVVNGTAGDFSAIVSNAGTSPTYQWRLNGANVGTNSSTYSNPSLSVNDVVTCEVTPDAPGCTPNPVSSNSITYIEENPAENTTIYIQNIAINSKCNKARTEVVWTDLSSVMNASGNDLSKSGTNSWDGGAASHQTLSDNGYAFTVVNETNTNRMFGLSTTNTNSSFNAIDYAIYLVNNGTLRIYESGVNRGSVGSYSSGDTAKVVVEDGVVQYYLNSTLLFTSSVVPTLPMVVDVSLNTNGSTLEDVFVVNGTAGDFSATVANAGVSPTYQWRLNGANVGTNSSTYSNASLSVNDVVTCEVTPDAPGCTPNPVGSNSITYIEENPAENTTIYIQNIAINSKCNKARTEVVWTDLSSVMNASNNDLSKSGANSWNGGAASQQTVSDNGYALTVINETNTNRMFGLSTTNTNTSFNAIDYAIYLVNNGTLRIYESGVNRGTVGSYSSGDTAKVVVEDGVVQYYLNSTLLFTSSVVPTLPMVVDVSLNTDGSTLEDVFVVNGTAGDFSATVANAGASPTYQWRLNGANVGTNSSTYSNASLSVNDVVTCEVTPDAPGCTPNPVGSNSITYIEENPTQNTAIYIDVVPTSSTCTQVETEVTWTGLNGGVAPMGNSLSKTGANAWDGGAASQQVVADNGYAYTVVNETNTYRMFGLSNTNTNGSFNSIDFAIYLVNNGTIRIYESGVNRGNFGAYNSGDTARVAVEAGVVNYYINSNLVYTSGVTPTLPMIVDLSIYSTGGTLEDIHTGNGFNGEFVATATNAGINPTYQWKLNGANVGTNSVNYSNTGLSLNDVVTCEVTADVTGCTTSPISSNASTVTIANLITTWNGGSSNWFTGANWSNGVPNASTTAIIPSTPNNPSISGANASCQSLNIQTSAGLTVSSSDTLFIHGDFINAGTFTPNQGTVQLNLNCDQTAANLDFSAAQTLHNLVINNTNGVQVSNGSIDLTGILTLTSGQFSTNNALTLISDATGTASIAEITGGSIVGDLTMQRYIPAGATNWRILTSPIVGAQFQDWNDDFITSGYPGSAYPSFPFVSISTYDETTLGTKDNGWQNPSGATQSIGVASAAFVYCGDASTGTAAFTIDVTGAPITGPQSASITYTDDPSQPADEDGWNLVGNPYPSAIDFSLTSRSGLDNSYWIRDPQSGNMETWNELTGTSSLGIADGNIASSQGFWVHAISASPTMSFEEGDKTATGAGVFKASSTPSVAMGIKISSNANTYWDRILLGTIDGAQDSIDQYDQFKLYSPSVGAPNIASTVGQLDMAMSFFDNWTTHRVIPIKIVTPVDGQYQLTFDHVNDINAHCLVLHDADLGTNTIITDSLVYSFNSLSGYDGTRFYITNMGNGSVSYSNASCSNTTDGTIAFLQNGATSWDYTVTSNNGLISSAVGVATDTFTLQGLAPGTYYATVSRTTPCGVLTSTDTITIQPTLAVDAEFVASADTVTLLAGTADVVFTNLSNGASTYEWDFGDGATSTLPNPTHSYLAAGLYEVELTAHQSSCVDTTRSAVLVQVPASLEELQSGVFEAYQSNDYLIINTPPKAAKGWSIVIFDVQGKMIYSAENLHDTTLQLNVKEWSTGTYVVRYLSVSAEEVESVKVLLR